MLDNQCLFSLFIVLFSAAWTDITSRRIPKAITFPCMIFGIFYHTCLRGVEGFLFSITGAGVAFTLLLLPYMIGWFGAGDIKLLSAIGSILGWKSVITAILFSSIAGGFISLYFILLWKYKINFDLPFKTQLNSLYVDWSTSKSRGLNYQRDQKNLVPYGLAIAIGTGAYKLLEIIGINASLI